jgi:23S rRNA A1618 N6-methylase RlmF
MMTSSALTTSLLKRDFKLTWTMPINHLCPPIPQRLNYIHWIADLLGVPWPRSPHASPIVGLDIGTGASAIFPLLGHASYGWRFVGTGE